MNIFKQLILAIIVFSGSSLTLAGLPFVNLHLVNQTTYPATLQGIIYYSIPNGESWKNISVNVLANGTSDYTDNLDNPQNGGMEITIQGKTVPCIPSNPSITSGASPLDDIAIFQRETFFYCEFTPSLN